MIITKELIEQGMSSKGGWSLKQVRLLGYEQWEKGWVKRSIGKYISDNDAQEFLRLKDEHLPSEKTIAPPIKHSKYIKRIKLAQIPGNEKLSLEEQYAHPNWQKVRLFIMQRDHFHCRICGFGDEQLHVHHLYYEGMYIWDVIQGALITLCNSCHSKVHRRNLA